ncbi:MFS transporter [Vibrio sagamiensis]|uniref:MFS transporter n=1 Tax=Vibrio sagamiensis NBRC 104589 TaxID=1219064 RepID=A0A511QDK1_9VIBR|nr:MFS transporter [Vibrio sagamiensis]GEM75384.1 MFS transporter [Vibrio sagamiensis NBRC 104589]
MSLTWKQRYCTIFGNAMEYYDIAIFASISPYISHVLSSQGIGDADMIIVCILALRFIVRPLGGILIGRYADNHGRKKALILSNILTGFATLCMSLIPVESVGPYIVFSFLFFQILQSFSFGGEYPTLIFFLLNDSKKSDHTRISSLIVSSSIVGVILSLIVVSSLEYFLTLEEMNEWGWRAALLVGLGNIMMSAYIRLSLPELKEEKTCESKLDYSSIFNVFALAMIGGVMFYLQNFASGIIGKSIQIENLCLINSSSLIVLILSFGYLIDKYSNPITAAKVGSLLTLLTSIPFVWMMESNQLLSQLIGAFGLSAVAALILSSLAATLWAYSEKTTINMAIGYNFALSIFGGLTPLIVTEAMRIDIVYVGVYVSVAALPSLFVLFSANRTMILFKC